jgi:hypothetical protein
MRLLLYDVSVVVTRKELQLLQSVLLYTVCSAVTSKGALKVLPSAGS